MNFVDVILPLPLNASFTYSVPEGMEGSLQIGTRVVVPFGRRKFYTAIVVKTHAPKPTAYEVKPIDRVLDAPGDPVIIHPQLKFWEWIAEYYLCSVGDVMKAALPAGLKLESETFVEPAADADAADREGLSEDEALIMQTLVHEGKLSVGDLVRKSGVRARPEQLLAALIERGLVMVSEKLMERYRARKQTVVCLPPESAAAGWRSMAFAKVSGAARQEQLLLTALQLAGKDLEVEQSVLLERSGCTQPILRQLANKGLVRIERREINRFAAREGMEPQPLPTLSAAQQTALNSILGTWIEGQKAVTLLRGVTSSGKTEVYIHLISRMLRQGKQVLMLVPEIALTTQLTERLQRVFGRRVIVYHSKFTDNERVDIWKRLLHSAEPAVVIGARSSVFLPFRNLGLVIVDEEHEPSYKQFDPAPRYNARDCAIVLASMHGAKTLLGSATPAIETYFKAQSGRYGLVELTERYGGVCLPEIEVVDMKKYWKQYWRDSPFAPEVHDRLQQTVAAGKQAIVFHNRRGFAPMARCKQCAYIPKCEHCDVSLTYHRREDRLICHYCGAEYKLPTVCPVCKEPSVEIIGYGTEKIEDLIEKDLPGARILRMDLDTTRNKDGYLDIINAFSSHKADILVGTQMVTKGLDFDGVRDVAVLSADTLINLPDFRASERAFNMLLQVAGRAGRRDVAGKVIIQTGQPDHPVIGFVKAHDYVGFYNSELAERKAHFFPPFTRMIIVYLRHREESAVQTAANAFATRLRQYLGNRVAGPDTPPVSRVQSMYIRRLMLKIESGASMAKVREVMRAVIESVHGDGLLRGTVVHFDVDPA